MSGGMFIVLGELIAVVLLFLLLIYTKNESPL